MILKREILLRKSPTGWYGFLLGMWGFCDVGTAVNPSWATQEISELNIRYHNVSRRTIIAIGSAICSSIRGAIGMAIGLRRTTFWWRAHYCDCQQNQVMLEATWKSIYVCLFTWYAGRLCSLYGKSRAESAVKRWLFRSLTRPRQNLFTECCPYKANPKSEISPPWGTEYASA